MRALLPSFAAIRRIPFVIWILVAQAFLLINAETIAPAGQADVLRTILIVYMLLQTAFFRFSPRVPGLTMNLNMAIVWLVSAFVVTAFVLAGIRGLVTGMLQVQAYAMGAPLFLVILHTLVVAVCEELIFRGFLPLLITPFLAQIAFGLFHASAYGFAPMMILTAIIAGFFFYIVMRKTNIWVPMGIHAAYNLVVLGVL